MIKPTAAHLSGFLVAAFCWLGTASHAAPTIPGSQHLDAAGIGELLISELNCLACHSPDDATAARLGSKPAPNLTYAGARIAGSYLADYLRDPHAARPGTTMPNVLGKLPAGKRQQVADELAAYLGSLGGKRPGNGAVEPPELVKGEKLFNTIGCAVCHVADGTDAHKLSLSHLPAKTGLDALTIFLKNPHTVRPGGRMPDLKLGDSEAKAIAAYLLRDQIDKNAPKEPSPGIRWERYEISGQQQKLPDFNKLKPVASGVTDSISYKGIESSGPMAIRFRGELVVDSEWDFHFHLTSDDGSRIIIDGKTVVNNDGRHGMKMQRGKVRLKAGSYPIEVQYFDGGGGRGLKLEWRRQAGELAPLGGKSLQHFPGATLKAPASPAAAPAAIAAGKKHFQDYGCAACHTQPKQPNNLTAPAFASLSGATCSTADYQLSPAQIGALKAVIANKAALQSKRTPEAEVRHQMARFNCASCHQREDWAGPGENAQALFKSAFTIDLGEMAYLPPNLGKVGDKLTADAIAKLIAGHGPTLRPYLKTRMPNFGKDAGAEFAAAFKAADAKPDTDELPELLGDKFHESVAVGDRLFGSSGLNCTSCHNFGNQPGGMNILNLYDARERYAAGGWRRYMANPLAFHNDRMPPFWPKVGDSHMPVKLPGLPEMSAEQQWNALFRYLQTAKLATTGGPAVQHELRPAAEPIVFHTFMEGVSPRSITIGNPGGVHAAFDADQVRLAKVWRGRFFQADGTWNGRAGKFMDPLSDDHLVLPPGPAFMRPAEPAQVWPVPQKHTRNVGGKFLGYRLDADRRPVFRYRVGNVIVEEQVRTAVSLFPKLVRRFTLIPQDGHADKLVFRAAIGKEILERDGAFIVNEVETVRFGAGEPCGPAPGQPPTPAKPAKFSNKVVKTEAGLDLRTTIPIPDHPVHFEVEVSW